jgi:hypothetical protein
MLSAFLDDGPFRAETILKLSFFKLLDKFRIVGLQALYT